MSRLSRALAAIALLLALSLGAVASAPAQAPEPTTPADAAFLATAASSNQFEVQTGRLAERRGRLRAVRVIGRMLVADHTRQLQLGAMAAQQLGLPVPPATPSAAQQGVIRRLSGLRGRRFDRAFLAAQLSAHNDAITLYVRENTTTASPTLRALTADALPVLGAHLGMVQLTRALFR